MNVSVKSVKQIVVSDFSADDLKKRVEKALDLLTKYIGLSLEEIHWVEDQAIRVLTGKDYESFVDNIVGNDYWACGVKPASYKAC